MHIHSYIDMFQSTKRTLTNAIIVDKELNKLANRFIDSQTQFAKMLVDNTIDATRYSIDTLTSNMGFKNDGK